MHRIQKLTQNGSSSNLVIVKPLLEYLGWHQGDYLTIEVLEDRTIRVRPVRDGDGSIVRPALFPKPVDAQVKA